MRKMVTAAFVSLDGVMQAPGGPEEDPTGGFKFGGWVWPHFDEAGGRAMDELFSRPFDLLLGRKTYDIFAAHWPYIETDPAEKNYDAGSAKIAKLFNDTTKHVATHAPDTLTWKNSKWLGKDVVAALEELKRGDGPDLLTQGSSALIQQLLANDLIDDLRLLIFPLVLGKGKRLFGEGAIPAAFKCVKSVTSPSGVIVASYERTGEVKTGSFVLQPPSEAELERRRKLK